MCVMTAGRGDATAQNESSAGRAMRPHASVTVATCVTWYVQGEATRRREAELVKLRKDVELLTVQHESSEASLRKRHQEAINELNDQIEQLSKHRNKSVYTAL